MLADRHTDKLIAIFRTATATTLERVCLLRHFDEKLFDEVFAVVGYSAETFVVELPVASSHVVQRVLVVAAGKRRQTAQPARTSSPIIAQETCRR